MSVFCRLIVLVTGALLWASPAPAVPAAPLSGVPLIVEAQFRLPWETKRRPARRTKRSARPERRAKPPTERSEKATRPEKPGQARPPAPARNDPMDAALPALTVPLALAAPRGATPREADNWARLAAEAPPPQDPPLISPDGPGPIPAATLAALASLKPAGPIETARLSPRPEDDEPETPDLHVPFPLERPAGPGETAPAAPAEAQDVPLPPRKPGETAALEPGDIPKPPSGPTAPDIDLPVASHDEDPDCRALAEQGFAEADRIPPIEGPGVCGGGPLVSLTAVKRKDGVLIKLRPAATLRCAMARELVDFMRDDVEPAARASGGSLNRLDIAGSFQCRGRNGAAGGKMSEHGRANAVDLSGFAFEDGRAFGIFAPDLPQGLSAAVKSAACARFSTVLGPGSDGFHETHLHVDLQPRRGKSKLCQWADPEVARAEEKEKDAPAAEKPAEPQSAPGRAERPDRAEDRTQEKAQEKVQEKAPDKKSAVRRRAEARPGPLPKRDRSP